MPGNILLPNPPILYASPGADGGIGSPPGNPVLVGRLVDGAADFGGAGLESCPNDITELTAKHPPISRSVAPRQIPAIRAVLLRFAGVATVQFAPSQ
jgi:hypothetical protein